MNLEQLKKNVSQRVRLRPIARRFDEHARELATKDDVWVLQSVTDVGIVLSNERTGHQPTLGKDHIYSYASDPGRTTPEMKHGFLTLHVQLFLRGFLAEIEPTPRPGEAALTVPLAISGPMSAMRNLRQYTELTVARQEYQTSPKGLREAAEAFERLFERFSAIAKEQRAAGNTNILVRRSEGYFIVVAFTYGISVLWLRSPITLQDAPLRLSVWDRTPRFPGAYSIVGEPQELHRSAYTFGLILPGHPGWMEREDAVSGFSSEEIAEAFFEDLAKRPRRDPFHYLADLGR